MNNRRHENIYLRSDSSLSIYNDNSLTNFTNILEEPIFFPKSQNWGVCIRSLIISPFVEKQPSIVKIKCSLTDNFQQNNQVIGIASFFGNSNQYSPTAIPHVIDFIHEDYYPLSQAEIRKINITLLDENNEQVKLQAGFPTTVKLHFSKIMNSNFNLHFSLRDSLKKSPKNTHNDFEMVLDNPIFLSGD